MHISVDIPVNQESEIFEKYPILKKANKNVNISFSLEIPSKLTHEGTTFFCTYKKGFTITDNSLVVEYVSIDDEKRVFYNPLTEKIE